MPVLQHFWAHNEALLLWIPDHDVGVISNCDRALYIFPVQQGAPGRCTSSVPDALVNDFALSTFVHIAGKPSWQGRDAAPCFQKSPVSRCFMEGGDGGMIGNDEIDYVLVQRGPKFFPVL